MRSDATGSRAYQSAVSNRLREQAVAALRDLLRGFEDADRLAGGAILREHRREGRLDEVHLGLVTVLLRMVFVLFAEERGLLPVESEGYASRYSLGRLHAVLERDRLQHGDALDDRHGAWGRVVALVRMIHDGGRAADGLVLPARRGSLFDPDAFPFLEGRRRGSRWNVEQTLDLPRVSDGVVHRVLDRLRMLDGHRLRYEGLDVEQIGSLYEGLMGFQVEVAEGNALHVRPGDGRRRTGAHYTPQALARAIVETTLRPVLERLGSAATADRILDLKVCDPAMGSGAFLVEACRQLGERLVEAWRRTNSMPDLPPEEAAELHARRLVARRSLYGVDKDPTAVELARMSMWLLTAAEGHPFTFLDHALLHGDSLVGLGLDQICNVSFDPAKGSTIAPAARDALRDAVQRSAELRGKIHEVGDGADDRELGDPCIRAGEALDVVRVVGDAMIACYFAHASDRARRKALAELAEKIPAWLLTRQGDSDLRRRVAGLHEGDPPLRPFHWEVELPEVFGPSAKARGRWGFDCFVGNPPFMKGSRISGAFGKPYLGWLLATNHESHGNADLAAYFFRLAHRSLAATGTAGLLATNTIAQGDTRTTSLRWIVRRGGTIYHAVRRVPWSGGAAVVASIVCFARGAGATRPVLDGQPVERITAYLHASGTSEDPRALPGRGRTYFSGSKVNGPFDLTVDEAMAFIREDPRNAEVIKPYLDGADMLRRPDVSHRRYVICFQEQSLEQARRWPEVLARVERDVRPRRARNAREHARERWWQFEHYRAPLYQAIAGMSRVLVHAFVSRHVAFAFVPSSTIVAAPHTVFAFDDWVTFSTLQSRVHEAWARAFASSLKDDLRYTASDCFETFPFPPVSPEESIGRIYYEHRAALMIAGNEGLSRTYNRFHDPADRTPGILRLRELHAAMDRAVLDAYGFADIVPDYDFHAQPDATTRYTWAEETRDEVLARLLQRNAVMSARRS